MVSEHEGSLPEPLPAVLVVEGLGSLQGNVDVHALKGEAEASLFVLHEVQGDLGITWNEIRSYSKNTRCIWIEK